MASSPAEARTERVFSIPAGRLSDALMVYADQAGVSIALDDPRLDRLHTQGLKGRFELSQSLRRLLRGSGCDFSFVDARTVRVFCSAVPSRRTARPAVASGPPPEARGPDIVVSATKQPVGLADYPSSISVVGFDDGDRARGGPQGTDYILHRLPGLASTNLGPGRNKIFIRGIADSSFNGASLSTISQYLGEARLIYSAPDPDLLLYDVASVEVLEGPQGTLYGAGTLGGIIRMTPEAPDTHETSMAMSSGARVTQDGAPGGDVAGVLNLPLKQGRLGARIVAYAARDGGYIDDTLRGRKDINRTSVTGFRGSLRWTPAKDWTIDLGIVGQNLASRDGQYSETDVGALARRSAIAQPFDNDYRLASLTLVHEWGNMKLVS
ncbi:MAG: TonB-dependent receptor plug domain-containing protein, partial [Novosphingobium sp.]|nr:TonB-dependent receptor plug domain-containing protein [Novosphingobium sp.]